jgi:hypothetical protein
MSFTHAARYGFSSVLAAVLVASLAAPASAQDTANAPDPNPGNLTFTGSFDFLNTYMFRGIRQDDTKVIMWPAVDLGMSVFSGDGGLKSVGVNVGSWNSLHTGSAGSDGPSGKLWYEGDFYATLGLGFGGGVSLGTTYTAYTSPNNMFSTVKEIAFKLGVDDSSYLGRGALKPYALVAFELSDDGQADAGEAKGTYVELGVAPGYAGSRASLAVPIKLGLSASDYYEFGTGEDSKFGYFSIGGLVTVPMGAHANIHGGLELQIFGDNVKDYNSFGDDPLDPSSSAPIVSIGLGFAF